MQSTVANFDTVLASEHAAINERRTPQEQVRFFCGWEAVGSNNGKKDLPSCIYDTVGLALSGGGIRSAAFCLGALQALDVADAFKSIDYLSTVSGGGYIGSSLSAGMSEQLPDGTPSEFPFESRLNRDETPIVQHIRDYSNYLVPHGWFDILESVAIYLRGLAANALLVLPWLLFAAAITIYANPTLEKLRTGSVLDSLLPGLFPIHFFALSALLLTAYALLLVGWSLWKSAQWNLSEPEIPGASIFFGAALIMIAICFICDLQPYVLAGLFTTEQQAQNSTAHGTSDSSVVVLLVHYITAALAPFAVVVGLLGNKIGAFANKITETDAFRTRALAAAGRIAMFVSALFVPLLLWIIYLQFSYWGISAHNEHWSTGLGWQLDYPAPTWIADLAAYLSNIPYFLSPSPIARVYLCGWLVFFLLSTLLSANENSLHRLYRDRLSKAFIVCPVQKLQSAAAPIETIDKVKLSHLNAKRSPYHLLNTALNLQASKYANRRGRNADFFLFSRNYIGSVTTGYVATNDLEMKVPEVDLATAMAVSGAAASSNMGSSSIRQWTLSLAILNVRLGYWLRNPRFISSRWRVEEIFHSLFNPYFLYEAFGLLNERRWFVNLSDGGHIENLGVYELLRRKCKLIIVVDAEDDPQMNFGSFVTLQRYARIDLGVRIELPWGRIRSVTLDVDQRMQTEGGVPLNLLSQAGPHCAVRRIFYPEGEGRLLYVKSSVSGDESDYVMDYKRRHASFPHETTGDQFFAEEQFEAYRALGFHALQGFFSDRDEIAAFDPKIIQQVKAELKFKQPTGVLPTLPK